MPTVKPLNVWGRSVSEGGVGLEAQRNDLWVLRLDAVLNYIEKSTVFTAGREAPSVNGADAFFGTKFSATSAFPRSLTSMLPQDAAYYTSSVELPELKTSSQVITRETRPYQMPGGDEPLGPVRVTFIHDVTSKGDYYGSSLDALLRIWRGLVRTGRGQMSSGDYAIPLGVIGDIVGPAGLLPCYSFDLRVDLFKGSSDGEGLDYSAGYLLKDAWLMSSQVGALRYAGSAANLEITASFAISDLVVDTTSTS